MAHTLSTLAFFAAHRGRHAFARDRATTRAVAALERRGFLLVDWPSRTAEFTGKVFA